MVFYDGKEEKHIIVNGGVPQSYKRTYLDRGAAGKCYITDSGDVFKETKINPQYFSDYIGVTKLESPFFAFPKFTIYEKERKPENFQGYTMDFVDGIAFKNLGPETEIRDLICALERLENEMFNLTKSEHLKFYDLNDGNIL